MTICLILVIVEVILLVVSFLDFISISYYDDFINLNRKFIFNVYRVISVILFIIVIVCGIICLINVYDLTNIIMYLTLSHFLLFSIVLLVCHIEGKHRYFKTLSKYIVMYRKKDSQLTDNEFIVYILKSLAVTYNMMYRYRDVKRAFKKYKVKETKKI